MHRASDGLSRATLQVSSVVGKKVDSRSKACDVQGALACMVGRMLLIIHEDLWYLLFKADM